jgi:hypothetical protein
MLVRAAKLLYVTLLMLVGSTGSSVAQCAMCRSTLENNFSNGDPGIAVGINTGILYLLAMPYLTVIILGYLWYKSSKHARAKLRSGVIGR